jgi:hypothetical protein
MVLGNLLLKNFIALRRRQSIKFGGRGIFAEVGTGNGEMTGRKIFI